MADLENNNPTTDNTATTNSEIVQVNDLKTNLEESTDIQQVDTNVSGDFTNNSSDNNVNINEQPLSNEIENPPTNLNNNSFVISEESPIQETPQTNILEESQTNELSEASNFTPEYESSNIGNAVINNPESQNSQQLNNTLPENSTTGENSPFEDAKAEEQQTKASQKEKLLQVIKAHESKAQKNGFIKGILTGVVAMIGIVTVGGFFAKDQIIDILNSIDNTSSLNANVIDLTENNNEEIVSEVLPEDESSEDNENSDIEEFNDSEYNENLNNNDNYDDNYENNYDDLNNKNNYDDNYNDNEISKNNEEVYLPENNETNNTESYENLKEESNNDIINENKEKADNTEDNTYKNDEETYSSENNEIIDNIESTTSNEKLSENNNPYTINHVNSIENANWVLPTHCSDLTCYGEDKEFTPCTTFRLVENLDENAHRIGNNGVCRYKDISELVYVEIK